MLAVLRVYSTSVTEPGESTDEGQQRFWGCRCAGGHKAWLLIVLVGCFVTQTALVYSDRSDTQLLNASAMRGRAIWQGHNCQVCHQLYGYGGFLGPDLTNAAGRISREQLAQQVAQGNDQMPAFGFDGRQVDDLWAFLLAMDASGQGQARQARLTSERTDIERVIGDAVDGTVDESGDGTDTGLVRKGFDLYRKGTCTGCHAYFARSAVDAPDLSRRVMELDESTLTRVLAQGKGTRMPRPRLDADEQLAMAAFLRFLSGHRDELVEQLDAHTEQPFFSSLPWWEYR